MLFFRKKSEEVSVNENIFLVVGLGNIGKKYDGTRHNIGFMVLDNIAQLSGVSFKPSRTGKGDEAVINIGGNRVMLLKPNTFMNRSGEAVLAVMKYYKISKHKLLVVSDDINLPAGKLRFLAKGSDGGHNGLFNISNRLQGDDFARLRIGVGQVPPEMDQADFVLSRFLSGEKTQIDMAISTAADGVNSWVTDGLDAAANRYNGI